MLQPTSFFVPVPFATLLPGTLFPGTQEPKSAPDTPAGPGQAPPTDATTQAPGGQGQPAAAPPGCAGDSSMFWIMGAGLLLMWLLVMRPEQKRRKEQQALLSSVKAGDNVVTLGGMHGVVFSLTDKTVTLRVDTAKMTFDRSAIARIVRDDATPIEAKKG